MKIALVTPFSLDHPGGVPEHVFHPRQEFLELGREVVVLAPHGERDELADDERSARTAADASRRQGFA